MSLSSPSSKPPSAIRKRRAAACERCNKRRVRCDASINGFPCFECRRSNNPDCRLVQSKRTRGPDGRYILPDQNDGPASTSPSAADGDGLRSKSESTPNPTKSAQEAQVPINLAKLVGADQDQDSLSGDESIDKPVSSREPSDESTVRPRTESKANFVGESWYASYVLSASGTGHAELHRPIERRQKTLSDTSLGHVHVADTRSPNSASNKPADLPPQHLTERLLEAYFKRFHCLVPILERAAFLTSVRDGSVSITLLRSVLFVASIHCDPEVYHLMGYSTRVDAGDDLWSKACMSFDADRDSDRTTMILASFLNHYFFGRPSEYRDSLWWLSNAIRSAQCMGYHRSTKDSKMPPQHKAQWKRVWWCLYMRDRQVCLATGSPMVINDLDFDVEDPTVDDFPDESKDVAMYIIAQSQLNRIGKSALILFHGLTDYHAVSALYFNHCSPRRLPLSHDPAVRQAARREMQATFEDWYASSPLMHTRIKSHHLTLCLQVCYHFSITTLQQRLQRLCPKPFADSEGSKFILEAANKVSTLVEECLLYYTPQHFPMTFITAIFTAMTAHVAECGISSASRDILSQKLRPNLLALKQFETTYILARWIRNLFMDIINKPARPPSAQWPSQASHQGQAAQRQPTQDSAMTPETLLRSHFQSGAITTPTDRSYSTGETPGPGMPKDDGSYVYDSNSFDHDASPSVIMGNFVPNFITNEFLPQQHGGNDISGMNMIDFPSPSSLEYQSLHFLADLGLSGFTGYQ